MRQQTETSVDQGRLGDLAARLVPAWRGRADSEHEQAVIRLGVGLVTAIYILMVVPRAGALSGPDQKVLWVIALFFLAALVILVWLAWTPRVSVPRRLFGMMTDIGAISAAYFLHEQLLGPFLVICLWVTLGNGFRFGRAYLALSSLLSVIGGVVVLTGSRHGGGSSYTAAAMLFGLTVLPAYVGALLKRLNTALQAAEDASQAKSRFLATMSHEIRTPLNGVVGVVELLARTDLDARQKEYLDLISRSAEWLMRVVTDGLDFSKIEEGELILETGVFDLHETIGELTRLYRRQQRNSGITFTCRVDDNLPRYLRGHPVQLVQVLNNLISNAVKFTDRGFITVQVDAAGSRGNVVDVRFAVMDSGIGIPVEKQAVIFEPFRQVDPSTSRRRGGTGLGLAISSRLVAMMGGELRVQSSPGEGSTFQFTLPLSEVDPREARSVAEPTPAGRIRWLRPPAILLAEDHEINRRVIVEQLTRLGCEVTVAADGREACDHFASQTFDLVLMDCEMPEVDGYEAVRRIRRMEAGKEGAAAVPIIALTAHVTREDRDKCLDAGMDDYLGKPYRLEALRNKLLSILGDLAADPADVDACPEPPAPAPNRQPEPEGWPGRELLHGLGNCLQDVIGLTELALDDEDLDEQHRQRCQEIIAAAEQALRFSRQLAEAVKATP